MGLPIYFRKNIHTRFVYKIQSVLRASDLLTLKGVVNSSQIPMCREERRGR